MTPNLPEAQCKNSWTKAFLDYRIIESAGTIYNRPRFIGTSTAPIGRYSPITAFVGGSRIVISFVLDSFDGMVLYFNNDYVVWNKIFPKRFCLG